MNMPNKILGRSLELIESGWTQKAYARDDTGARVLSTSPNACSWCSAGARKKAVRDLGASHAEEQMALRTLEKAMGSSAPHFNDTHTKAEVVAAFKAAIEASK